MKIVTASTFMATLHLYIPSSAACPSIVTALLSLSYSGGAGLAAGFCRHVGVAISLHVRPSVHVLQCSAESSSPITTGNASSNVDDGDVGGVVEAGSGGGVGGGSRFQMTLKLRNLSGGSVSVWSRGSATAKKDDVEGVEASVLIPSDGESVSVYRPLPL